MSRISGTLHGRDWLRLQEESCALRERGLAQGTWQNKVSHLRQYVTFTVYYNVPDFPVNLTILLRFIALLGRSSLAANSASNIVASIRWFTAFLDPLSVKTFDSVLVTASLRGLRAELSRPVRQMLPFSVDHLCKFYLCLDFSDVSHLSCWCAMLLAFFGCFRLSNLVPGSKNKYDPIKQLSRDDVKFENDIVLIFYKWSKTNQNCNRVAWIPIYRVNDERFDAKIYFKLLLDIVKAPKEAPLFSFRKNKFHTRNRYPC